MSIGLNELHELNAFVDGELELTKQLDLEARIALDPALRDEVARLRGLRDAVREHSDYHALPDALRARLGSPAPSTLPNARSRPEAPRWLVWRPLAAGFAMAAVLGGVFIAIASGRGADERLMQEVIASHVRSTVGQRLVDVASSDQHTVKPWLSARLDYSPPVTDVPVPGASFVGGRVDYLAGRPVATLVYRQRQHVIDAYVWPAAQEDAGPQALSQRGFNAVHWVRGGMRFWLVSDLNRDELGGFARALDQADAR